MEKLFETLHLFYPQILMGLVLGSIISFLGVILVLRKMAFFGVTLSQAVSAAVALSLFTGWRGNFPVVLLSCVFFLPLILLKKQNMGESNTLLGILFVSYAALSQVLLSFGGNVQNHILAAYFGDILTSSISADVTSFFLVGFSLIVYILIYRKVFFLAFDEDEFRIRKQNVFLIEFLYNLVIIIVLSICVNLLGSFFSIAHLLIPAYTGLLFARSMRFLFVFSFLFSTMATLSGFLFSLLPWTYRGTELYFPTSSIIILFMFLSFVLIYAIKKCITYFLIREKYFH